MGNRKFKELLLYIAKQSEGDRNFGAVKLNKLLFFADAFHYARYGESVTGVPYINQQFGPVPKELVDARDELIADGDAAIQKRQVFGHVQHRLVALRDPDVGAFTSAELNVVDDVLKECAHRNGDDLTRESHGMAGWRLAFRGEEIPYQAVFIDDRELTEDEKLQGLRLCGMS